MFVWKPLDADISRLADTDNDVADDRREVDVGKVPQGDSLSHEFAIYNSTSRPITVTAIQRSCGCEALDLVVGTVIPTGEPVKFRYGMPTRQHGHRAAVLRVFTDSLDESFREIRIVLRAEIIALVEASPCLVQCGNVVQGQQRSWQVTLTSADPQILAGFRSATAVHGIVECTVKDRSPGKLVVSVEIPLSAPLGRIRDSILLGFDRQLNLPVRLNIPVDGEIIADPKLDIQYLQTP